MEDSEAADDNFNDDLKYRTINFQLQSNEGNPEQYSRQQSKLYGLEISHANSDDQKINFRRLEHVITTGELDHLSLVNCAFHDADFMSIMNFLHQGNQLQSLAIRNTPMDSFKPRLLQNYLKNHCKLRFLTLQRNFFDQGGLNNLLHSFSLNKTLIHLSMRANIFYDKSNTHFLSLSLHNLRALVSLDLSNNKIGDSSVLSNALAHPNTCPHLRYFCLTNSHVEDVFDLTLTIFNTTLYLYELSLNSIHLLEYGFTTIAECLKHGRNPQLQVLRLSNCKGGASGTKALVEALWSHKGVVYLDISGNKGGVSLGEDIKQLLLINETLMLLRVKKNKLRTEGAKAIYYGLKDNQTLTHLDLRKNKVSEAFKEVFMEKVDKFGGATLDLLL